MLASRWKRARRASDLRKGRDLDGDATGRIQFLRLENHAHAAAADLADDAKVAELSAGQRVERAMFVRRRLAVGLPAFHGGQQGKQVVNFRR